MRSFQFTRLLPGGLSRILNAIVLGRVQNREISFNALHK